MDEDYHVDHRTQNTGVARVWHKIVQLKAFLGSFITDRTCVTSFSFSHTDAFISAVA